MAETDRRRYQRYTVRCDCWLERDEATIYGTTADVGMGGLFLRTAIPIPEGRLVDVVLNVVGTRETVEAKGVVTRAIRAKVGSRHGVGVEFVEIRQGRQTLMGFLGKHTSAAYQG